MSQLPPIEAPPVDDTPTDERPPYGDPSRWPVVVAVLVVAAAVVTALVLAGLAARTLWRMIRSRNDDEVIIVTTPADPYLGPTYRVEFYDGNHRQLADKRLTAVLPVVDGPAGDAALDRLARQLAAQVELRDGQRCFEPRVEVYDGRGRLVRSWGIA